MQITINVISAKWNINFGHYFMAGTVHDKDVLMKNTVVILLFMERHIFRYCAVPLLSYDVRLQSTKNLNNCRIYA